MTDPVTAALIGAGAGILGALLGVYFSSALESRKRRLQTTFLLHESLNTGEILCARASAHTLLLSLPQKDLKEIEDADPEKGNSIWLILNYFSRLHYAVNLGQVECDYVPSMFGEMIVWWWIVHFKDRPPDPKWTSYQNFEDLYTWHKRFCNGSVYQVRCDEWTRRAEADRNKHYP